MGCFRTASDCVRFPSTLWARPIGKIWEVSIPIGGVELEGF